MEFPVRLALFNEKAQKLAARSFFSRLLAEHTQASLSVHTSGDWTARFTGPDDESIDASVLIIRQFMQDNDPISVRNTANAYRSSDAPTELVSEFLAFRDAMNEYLDRPSSIRVEGGATILSNREVLEMFIYGSLGHASEPHLSRSRSFENTPAYPLVKLVFVDVLGTFIAGLVKLREINSEVLRRLEKSQSFDAR